MCATVDLYDKPRPGGAGPGRDHDERTLIVTEESLPADGPPPLRVPADASLAEAVFAGLYIHDELHLFGDPDGVLSEPPPLARAVQEALEQLSASVVPEHRERPPDDDVATDPALLVDCLADAPHAPSPRRRRDVATMTFR